MNLFVVGLPFFVVLIMLLEGLFLIVFVRICCAGYFSGVRKSGEVKLYCHWFGF